MGSGSGEELGGCLLNFFFPKDLLASVTCLLAGFLHHENVKEKSVYVIPGLAGCVASYSSTCSLFHT